MWPFRTKAAAPEETKAEPSGLVNPTEWFATHFGGAPDDMSITAQVAISVPAVASALRLISESAACLDVKVQRKNGGNWEDVVDHPAVKLLRGKANEWTSGFELTRAILVEAMTNDPGGFALVTHASDGRPIEIVKYKHNQIQVEFAADGSGRPLYKLNGRELDSSRVVHVRNTFNTSPITHAREAIAFARGLQGYGRNLFANGARPGGVLKTKNKIGDKGIENMLTAWGKVFGGAHNAGKTPVLWDDTEYVQLGLSSTDAQFLENRKFQNEEIARAFRVPPTMIFDLDRGTWGNAEQMGREFLVYCLEPWLQELEGAYGRALLSKDEAATHRILFDRDDLTRADLVSRATAISSFITARAISPNEARAWIDLPPRDGGDEYANPAIDTVKTPAPANDNQPQQEAAA